MAKSNNYEVSLLYSDPAKFVERYQGLIHFIVKKIAHGYFFNKERHQDLVQIINEKLLSGVLERIKKNYNGSVKLSTYVFRVVMNLCLEEIRKDSVNLNLLTDVDDINHSANYEKIYVNDLIIEDEIERLKTTLKLLPGNTKKLIFCLKAICHVKFNLDEVLDFFPKCKITDAENFLSNLRELNSSTKDKEILILLQNFINEYENNSQNYDSLRKWIDLNLAEIIELMNCKPQLYNYDRKTIMILFEKYFAKGV